MFVSASVSVFAQIRLFHLPESRLPVLLMELMDENLTKMLERSLLPVSYHVQVDLCHDISLAVAFLHLNEIFHRDLSGNNVLVVAGRRAKVTDFGMSKFNVGQHMTPLTMCPGTLAYMSPEALKEPPQYTDKLDVFSQGVIVIQVCSRQFPNPGPPRREIEDPRSPVGTTEVPVLERERRKEHIVLIDPRNPLLAIAMDCIEYRERDRPTASQLCERLTRLKEQPLYTDSKHHIASETEKMAREFQQERERLMEQIQNKNELVREMIASHESGNSLHFQEIEKKNQVITARNTEIERLQLQLEEKDREVSELSQRLQLKGQANAQFPQHSQIEHQRQLSQPKLKWINKRTVTCEVIRQATTVIDGDMVYVPTSLHQIHAYNTKSQDWSPLPPCPNDLQTCCLALVKGLLTVIGGQEQSSISSSNKLISMLIGHWEEKFPRMATPRCHPVAVSYNNHLVVAGGIKQALFRDSHITTVEVLNTDTMVWSMAASLPHPYSSASATICGDRLYMLGGLERGSYSLSVLTCDLSELLQSCETSSLALDFKRTLGLAAQRSSNLQVWERATDMPVYCSTCVSIHGKLIAIGGCDDSDIPTTAVYYYDTTIKEWSIISRMTVARWRSHVVCVEDNELTELYVIGGCYNWRNSDANVIEIAVVF